MNDLSDKQRLLDAAQAAVADAREKEEARARERARGKGPRYVFLAFCAALIGTGGWALATRPAWLVAPPPRPDPPALADASVRLTLVREAERIQAWRREHGRLPAGPGEAGSLVEGLAYGVISDSVFVLTMQSGPGALSFRSTDSAGPFLGDALRTVQGRVGR